MTDRPAVHILGSFAFLRRADITTAVRDLGCVDFLADSGAFSVATGGKTVTVADYGAWLHEHSTVINAAATLDVIGDPRATARNTEQLTSIVGGRVPIMGVFHVGSPWHELERLCGRHAYIALGGALGIGGRRDAMLRWCARAHLIARIHGVRLHGFSLTKPPYPELLPWYSVDSSYWTSAPRTGSLSLWDGRRFIGLRVGTPAAARHSRIIASYGGDPVAASTHGFGRVGIVGTRGVREREWMGAASIASFRRYELDIRSRRDPVAPPPGMTGDGLKLYQAVSSVRDMAFVVDAVAAAMTPPNPDVRTTRAS